MPVAAVVRETACPYPIPTHSSLSSAKKVRKVIKSTKSIKTKKSRSVRRRIGGDQWERGASERTKKSGAGGTVESYSKEPCVRQRQQRKRREVVERGKE